MESSSVNLYSASIRFLFAVSLNRTMNYLGKFFAPINDLADKYTTIQYTFRVMAEMPELTF